MSHFIFRFQQYSYFQTAYFKENHYLVISRKFVSGGIAIVSKTFGEGDKEKANKYFSMFIYFEIILGIMFTIIGLFVLEPVAKLLGATEDMLEYCLIYGRVLLYGITFFLQDIIIGQIILMN